MLRDLNGLVSTIQSEAILADRLKRTADARRSERKKSLPKLPGCTEPTLRELNARCGILRWKNLVKLANALGVTLAELFAQK